MSRFLKSFYFVVLLSVFAQRGSAFSLLGPWDSWEDKNVAQHLAGDIGGAMNLHEEYRWNTPFVTYGFDESFINYFGSNGVAAVEQAIAILNDLPNASAMNVDDYPFNSQRLNFRAQGALLVDLKSTALTYLLEEMGLAEPERYVWTLRDRVPNTTLNFTNYSVIQRNFDPIPPNFPTSFINGKLYTYNDIQEIGTVIGPGARPVIETADPLAFPFNSTVASGDFPGFGSFYSGLTYDDVGGLRYLLLNNNTNVETLLPDVREVFTNTPTFLKTEDYSLLILRSQNTTNDPAQLLAFYPGLQITASNPFSGFIVTTNVTTYFTNYPAAPVQIFVTSYTTNFVTLYNYEFGNVVADPVYTTRPVLVVTNEVVPADFYSPGLSTVQTNYLGSKTNIQEILNGEFYILPTNILSYSFLSNVLTTTTNTTNIDFFARAELLIRTNSQRTNIITTDLFTFMEQARTNDPAALLALHPDLLILSTNLDFPVVVRSNFVDVLTNFPYDPAGTLTLTQQVVYTTNVETNYSYIFGNVVTNTFFTEGPMIIEQSVAAVNPFNPAGTIETNTFSSVTVTVNYPNGSIYVVPTNLLGYSLSLLFPETQYFTNTFVTTNNFGGIEQTNTLNIIRPATNYWFSAYPIEILNTNDFGTNVFGLRRERITTATNRLFAIQEIGLRDPAISTGLRFGVDKITFVRMETGTNSVAVTNRYIDRVMITNTLVEQTVQRVTTRPDILFTARDLGTDVGGFPVQIRRTDTGGWINNDGINGTETLAGPGVIVPQVRIEFSKVGPFSGNSSQGNGSFLGETVRDFVWGSFDGSTNAPIVYPEGTSLSDLEQAVQASGIIFINGGFIVPSGP